MEGFKDAFDYTEYTAIRGTFIHYNVLGGMSFSPIDPEGLPPASRWTHRKERLLSEVTAAKRLWAESGIEIRHPMSIEQPYYHPDLGYAGQIDFHGMVRLPGEDDFVYTIMDLKTSRQVNDKHRVQVGAYAQMFNIWNSDAPATRGLVVSLYPAARRAIVCNIPQSELLFEMEAFNECLDKFWCIPGIRQEYGLL